MQLEHIRAPDTAQVWLMRCLPASVGRRCLSQTFPFIFSSRKCVSLWSINARASNMTPNPGSLPGDTAFCGWDRAWQALSPQGPPWFAVRSPRPTFLHEVRSEERIRRHHGPALCPTPHSSVGFLGRTSPKCAEESLSPLAPPSLQGEACDSFVASLGAR